MMPSEGIVFDIRRYAVNDGPGIRVTVFLKGCNLRCAWCHNPEGISPEPERLFTASKCIGCATCVSVCPQEALFMNGHRVATLTERCTDCGDCASVCPSKALEMAGERMSVDTIMEVIEKERVFMEESGGGVTFSGGEPLLQWLFLETMLKECGERNIHRAIDTAGNVDQEVLRRIAPHTDLFLYDLKLMDGQKHREWTGVSNQRILDNLWFLSESGSRIFIRIPFITGVNDDETNLLETVSFIRSLPKPPEAIYLLPYHPIARHKFAKLEREDDFVLFEEPAGEAIEAAELVLRSTGVPVYTGG